MQTLLMLQQLVIAITCRWCRCQKLFLQNQSVMNYAQMQGGGCCIVKSVVLKGKIKFSNMSPAYHNLICSIHNVLWRTNQNMPGHMRHFSLKFFRFQFVNFKKIVKISLNLFSHDVKMFYDVNSYIGKLQSGQHETLTVRGEVNP